MRSSRVVVAVAVCLGIAALPAQASFPGTNGKVVQAADCNLWVMNPDGTQEQQITFEPCGSLTPPRDPDWSPDGTKIAYSNFQDILLIGPDGSGQTNLTNTEGVLEYRPSWSPDGTRIAYERRTVSSETLGRAQLWIANADGTNQTPLVDTMCAAANPQWHPDGTRIAFEGAVAWVGPGTNDCEPRSLWTIHPDGAGLAPLPTEGIYDWSPNGATVTYSKAVAPGNTEIFVQDVDGSPPTMITSDPRLDQLPHWSPDGTKVLFVRKIDSVNILHTMNADGSGVTPISTHRTTDSSWQPIPVNAYPRPKGAGPTQVSLVPAYEQCTAANRTHGPPLAFGSCSPPTQIPGQLTVGTVDANGQPANSVSYMRVNPILGNPATPADEADVRLRAHIDDVRLRSDLSDYTGNLAARLTIQIIDRDNAPHPGGPGPATVQDFTYSHPIPCAATGLTTVGSTCEIESTVEALIPGAVKEQRRAIWQLGPVRVYDGAGDLFMTQGIFVP